VYGVNTYDHATYPHFHHQFWHLQLIVNYDSHYKNIIFPFFCDYYSTINKLITKKIIFNLYYLIMNFFPINY